MENILIKNGFLLTMTNDEPKISIKDILIEGSIIKEIDNVISINKADKIIDANNKVVMPGLINCCCGVT